MSAPERAPRIGLLGRLASGNLGNDATFEALLGHLRAEHPSAVLDGMCPGPEVLTARYGIPAAQLHWLHTRRAPRSWPARAVLTVPRIALGALVDAWRTIAWTRRHDVVLVPGMGVFESNVPQRPWTFPYSLALLSITARLCGTKVAYVSVGATVVRQRATRLLMRIGAQLAHYRSFRDQDSLDAALEMGFASAHDQVYPDLVFALPTPAVEPGTTGTIGVGVMAYYGGADDRARSDELHAAYLAKMRRFVRWLVTSGYRVQLFVGDDADEPVVAELLAEAGKGNACYDRCDTYDELMRQVARVDIMVGTRFHNVIAALKCGTPTISIGYGRKHAAVMRLMGLGAYVHDIRDFDVDGLIEQLSVVVHEREQIAADLSARHDSIVRELEDQFGALSAEVFASPSPRVRSVRT